MKVNPNSLKFLVLLGIVLLIVSVIFQGNSLIMVFACLSGFLFLIISGVKAVINKLSKSTDTNMPQKFWPIMGIFLLLFFGVCYAGSKSPPTKKKEIVKANIPTQTLSREEVQQEVKNKLTEIDGQAKQAPSPTPSPTSTTTNVIPTIKQLTPIPTLKPTLKPTLPITTYENGRQIFTDLGWKIYTAQFIKPSLNGGCTKDMDTCPYWEELAKQYSVNVGDVKFILYEASSVALNAKYQKISDEYNQGLDAISSQTNETEEKFTKEFAIKNGLKDYELEAIFVKGWTYKPETNVTEDYIRTALTQTNNIIPKDGLTEIRILDNLGTKDNNVDKVVHVYFRPQSIWDEKDLVHQSAVKAAESMKVLFANPQITHIVFWTLWDFTDSYGNNNQATALRVSLTSIIASKINWDNFIPMVEVDYNKLFDIADEKYVHPSIAKVLNLYWR